MEKVSKRNRREEKEATDLFASTDPFLRKFLGRNERREFVSARKGLDIMILGCVDVVVVLVFKKCKGISPHPVSKRKSCIWYRYEIFYL